MAKIVVQMGHVPRTSGATGTHREQEFNKKVGPALRDALIARGHEVFLIGADDAVPHSNVFISLHTDGNTNPAIRGASVGYPDATGQMLAAAWKRAHQRNGFPGGFHRDNYTSGLRYYYGFRRTNALYRFLAEHGTTTNRADEAWLFSNLGACVVAHIEAIGEVVGHPHNPREEKVNPEINPPMCFVSKLIHPKTGGAAVLLADGGVATFNTPYCGNVFNKVYFSGRKPARLLINPQWNQDEHNGSMSQPWYIIQATSGETYGHAGF